MDSDYLQERQVLRRQVIACYVHLDCRSMNIFKGSSSLRKASKLVFTSYVEQVKLAYLW